MTPFLSEISVHTGSGKAVSNNLFNIFIWILIGLILWGLGTYFFPKLGMPAKGMLVWNGLFILIAVIIVINFLAGLTGNPLFNW